MSFTLSITGNIVFFELLNFLNSLTLRNSYAWLELMQLKSIE